MSTKAEDDAHQALAESRSSRLVTMPEHTRAFVLGLAGESPRGKLLVVGEYCDQAVTKLLRVMCVNVKQVDELIGREGATTPLGTFSARIKACWCFGLLPENEYVNLEQIRKMRNYVAHNLDPIHFDINKLKQHAAAMRVEREEGGAEPMA